MDVEHSCSFPTFPLFTTTYTPGPPPFLVLPSYHSYSPRLIPPPRTRFLFPQVYVILPALAPAHGLLHTHVAWRTTPHTPHCRTLGPVHGCYTVAAVTLRLRPLPLYRFFTVPLPFTVWVTLHVGSGCGLDTVHRTFAHTPPRTFCTFGSPPHTHTFCDLHCYTFTHPTPHLQVTHTLPHRFLGFPHTGLFCAHTVGYVFPIYTHTFVWTVAVPTHTCHLHTAP